MAPQDLNRYSLFREGDVELPKLAPPEDPSKNPFLNQVADDPEPWQDVKKRGAPPLPAPAPSTRTLVIKDAHKPLQHRTSSTQEVRTRTVSNATATSDKPYDPHENWCGACSIKFPNKNALQSHMKQTPDHKHYCNLCVRVFKDRNGLKNHVDNTKGHETSCNLCLSAFKDEWGLKNHFENNYQVDHRFVCLTCLLGFQSQVELNKHLQTAKKHTWCMTCKRPFRSQDERDKHWRTTTAHKHCLQVGCEFDGQDVAALEAHYERDHFRCDGCRRIFPSQTKLFQHQESCNLPVPCPHCGELCAGQGGLARHLQQCFACDQCNFYTSHEGNLRIHMTKHAVAAIPCWGCGIPLRTFSSLVNHLESGACPKFHNPSTLLQAVGEWWYSPLFMDLDIHAQIRTRRIDVDEVHEWMHSGILMPFICRAEACKKTFCHLSSLILHLESQSCEWGIERLNAPGLEVLFKGRCIRRDSGQD
ncbi:hypothetical protein OPT61_g516 [Boeremia exigua]|uniref:Uncharacterized protein n=1 Tax=Boeremia exigua TaxID=749465 RepID=A0ACC2ITH4_9PLEO|nr:hypothetical protein OPT61_g516 [Boeremia exigua]